MPDAFICDAIRTPVGRYGGSPGNSICPEHYKLVSELIDIS